MYGYAKKELPSASAIHRYLQTCGFIKTRVPKSDLPQQQAPLVDHPHDLWEMDAQGAVAVQGLGYISMINIKDHKSKAYVGAFPVQVKGGKSQPKTLHYLWALRLAFEEFGLPKAIQVDKDSVFIDTTSKSPIPSAVHLFVLGLGIELRFIDVAPPAKQAMVERAHQTLDKQVLKGKNYSNWQALFANTNQRRKVLNEKYPCRTLARRAPLQAFPDALHSGRTYSVEQEMNLLKINRIEQYLAKCTWFRKVSASKTISLRKIYYLKQATPGTYVQITFCMLNQQLIVRDVNEHLIERIAVDDFAAQLLLRLSRKLLLMTKRKLFKNKTFPLE